MATATIPKLNSWPSNPQLKTLLENRDVTGDRYKLSDEDFNEAATVLMVDVKLLKAFAIVEGGRWGGFLSSGEPVILFERHLFDRFTKGKYRSKVVGNLPSNIAKISSPVPGGYGPVSIQHEKLQFASALDRNAALMSASWGLFQILGANHVRAGFSLLQTFVNAMYRSVDDHLWSLVGFIMSDSKLWQALRNKDFKRIAELYNGRAQNGYDVKIKKAYLGMS